MPVAIAAETPPTLTRTIPLSCGESCGDHDETGSQTSRNPIRHIIETGRSPAEIDIPGIAMADHGIKRADRLVRDGQRRPSDRQIYQWRNHSIRSAFGNRFDRSTDNLGLGQGFSVSPHNLRHSLARTY